VYKHLIVHSTDNKNATKPMA
jgi:sorbitol-specific phosphotransferase system component IIBC